jgi:hypothetical protein
MTRREINNSNNTQEFCVSRGNIHRVKYLYILLFEALKIYFNLGSVI